MSFEIDCNGNVMISDIISNLDSFSSNDLDRLASELSEYNIELGTNDDISLYDEMKKTAIMELYELISLDDINLLIKNKRK